MLAIVGVALLSGCGGSSADTPQATVTGLLELRSANSTDAAAYASFVTTPVAEALAADSAAREEGSDAVPQWETPEVTKESDSAAEVRVAWVRSAEHSAWPETTTFVLQRVDDAWLIVDAVEEAPSDAAPGEDSR